MNNRWPSKTNIMYLYLYLIVNVVTHKRAVVKCTDNKKVVRRSETKTSNPLTLANPATSIAHDATHQTIICSGGTDSTTGWNASSKHDLR